MPGATRSSVGTILRVSCSSLIVAGFGESLSVSSAVAPLAAAMSAAVRRILAMASSRMSGRKVRKVPSISTESGMMLCRTPPLIAPIVTMAGTSVMSSWRLTMVCRPTTICAATTIGSTPFQGRAPWVCLPV
ncbi:MAG TPA: hypothetical protein VK844_04385, partial [Hyphomicrobiales bacterium]|nr:hypothetical protein [Hyphomicrobiales bacterium]